MSNSITSRIADEIVMDSSHVEKIQIPGLNIKATKSTFSPKL